MNRNQKPKTRKHHHHSSSTVRLLEPRTCATPTKLLGLAAPGIRDEQGTIVPHQNVLDLLLTLFINVLLVERDERLGDALADGVDLGGVAATLDADAHVDAGEAALTQQEDRLEGLEAEDLRLHELNGAAVDLDETAPALAVGHGHGGLLATEALHLLQRCLPVLRLRLRLRLRHCWFVVLLCELENPNSVR